MNFKWALPLLFSFIFANAHGQTTNFKNAGQCYGMVLASFNAGLIEKSDLNPSLLSVMKKYGSTYNRIALKMDKCTGKNDSLTERCVQNLESKDDTDFMLGFFGAYGFVRSGKMQGVKGVALEYIAGLCRGVT